LPNTLLEAANHQLFHLHHVGKGAWLFHEFAHIFGYNLPTQAIFVLAPAALFRFRHSRELSPEVVDLGLVLAGYGLWDALTLPHPLISYQTPQRRYICAVQWSPDGKVVAFLEASRRVQLFHVATGTPLWDRIHGTDAALGDADEPDEETARIGDLAFSSDGSLLASVGDNGVPWLWDVATGTHIGSLHSAEDVRTLAFHPSRSTEPYGLSHLVTGSQQGTIQVWPVYPCI
jgi:hypothetical protein